MWAHIASKWPGLRNRRQALGEFEGLAEDKVSGPRAMSWTEDQNGSCGGWAPFPCLGDILVFESGCTQGPRPGFVSPLSPPSKASQIEVIAPTPLGSDDGHLLVALDSQSVFPGIMAKCGVKQR